MLIQAKVWTVTKTDRGNVVLLQPEEEDQAVPIFIGTSEAQNLLLGLAKEELPRPLTHDLMLNLLSDLGVKLIRIEIHSLVGGTFFANLILDQGGEEKAVDARPSDALALAIRCDALILIEKSIVEETAIPLQYKEPQEASAAQPTEPELKGDVADPEEKKKELESLLEKYVSEERYEDAAKLRDQLKELDNN